MRESASTLGTRVAGSCSGIALRIGRTLRFYGFNARYTPNMYLRHGGSKAVCLTVYDTVHRFKRRMLRHSDTDCGRSMDMRNPNFSSMLPDAVPKSHIHPKGNRSPKWRHSVTQHARAPIAIEACTRGESMRVGASGARAASRGGIRMCVEDIGCRCVSRRVEACRCVPAGRSRRRRACHAR